MSLLLFTKTYKNDLPWMELALKSVAFFCSVPVDWTIVVESAQHDELQDILMRLRLWKNNHEIHVKIIKSEEVWPESAQMNGYMGQQWIKMNAHRVMGNSVFWCVDSDCVFQKPFQQSDFIGKSGRPIYFFSHFNTLMAGGGKDNPAHKARCAVMKQIFRFEDISFEFMRGMPIPMNGTILEHGSRNRIWDESKDKLLRGDRSFSEFNIIGQFSHFFFPDAYEWRNAEAQPPTFSGGYVQGGDGSGNLDGVSIVTQFWSYSGVPEDVKNWVNELCK